LFLSVSIFGLLSCLLLGGGTKGGFLSDAILQLLATPILLAALWRVLEAPDSREKRSALTFCAVILALPLIQLIPLPPAIWTHLPGGELAAEAFELLGRPPSWRPISLTPEATWLSTLSLLPPFAIFLSVLTLDWRDRRRISLVPIAVAVISVFEITNVNDAVGFFANRNHFAALLYSAILLTAAMLAPQVEALFLGDSGRRARIDGYPAMRAIGLGIALIVLISGEAIARSRAGIILAAVALFAGLVIGGEHRRLVQNISFSRVLVAVSAFAIVFIGQSSWSRLLDRFDADPLADGRVILARNTIAAAKSVTPFGAGLGSFPSFYPTFEKPVDLTAGAYANHAHNDFLELWLETGVVGPILLGLFLIWAARKAIAGWASPNSSLHAADRTLMRASFIIILLLLGHSLVDYPLRTSAIMGIFAFCCGLLVDPLPLSVSRISASSTVNDKYGAQRRRRRHREHPAADDDYSNPEKAEFKSVSPGLRRGDRPHTDEGSHTKISGRLSPSIY
jgi:O-antigen ligase